MRWMRQIEHGPDALHVHPPAEQEQREEAERHEQIAYGERQAALRGYRRKHQEHTLQEDRDQAHERDDDERSVTLGRPPRQALEQIHERDEPADDEDHPREREPRLQQEAMQEVP